MAQCRPNLRVIGETALPEAAEARPSLLVSVAVLKHVPVDEWDTCFDRLMRLVSARTRLVITFTAGERLGRIRGSGWCCRSDDMAAEVEGRRPGARITVHRRGETKRESGHVVAETSLLATWPD